MPHKETPVEEFVDVLNVADAVYSEMRESKAGYKTTEFWLTLAGILGTQIGALDLPGEHGKTITTVALAVAYVLSRGVAKAGVPTVAS